MESVLRDDPYCQMWHFMSCIPLLCLGLEEAAMAANRKASELDPQLWVASMALGVLHASRGRYAEARVCAEKAFSSASWSPYCIGLMAAVLRNAGEAEKAAELLGKLRDDAYGGPAGLTCYHFSCGEIDSAVEWAGKAVEQRFSGITATLIRPFESAPDLISPNIGDSRSHDPAQRWMHELQLHAPTNVLHLEHRPAPR